MVSSLLLVFLVVGAGAMPPGTRQVAGPVVRVAITTGVVLAMSQPPSEPMPLPARPTP